MLFSGRTFCTRSRFGFFAILLGVWCLASNPGLVFSREHLLQSIWGYDFLGDTRAVDSHIKRIRAKLCRDTNHWDIKTVWGVGYRFEMVS